MKRKLTTVFEPVKEFMYEVKSDLKEFTSEMDHNSILSSLDYSIRTINSVSKLLIAQSDDNYIEYGDLMYPSDIFDRIIRKHDSDRKNNRRAKNKLNIEELFEQSDQSKIKFQKNLGITKKFLNSIEDFKEDNNSFLVENSNSET